MALASLLLALQGADIATLLRDLDHDEYEVRRNAFTGLVKVGKSALPALHEARRSRPSLEVRDAAPRIIDAILVRIREDFILEHAAKPKNFACGGLSFSSPSESEQRMKHLASWFPGCEFLVGRFHCMHRVQICGGGWLLGLSREDGEIFTIRKLVGRREELTLGDPAVLSHHLKPARDAVDAVLVAQLLSQSKEQATVTEAGGRRTVSWPSLVVEFDAEGRLVRISKGLLR